jgi:glycosyltransferase involved in cell wall biosynthesis
MPGEGRSAGIAVRVWIVNQYAIPPSQSGATRHFSLARALRSRGIEVEIFSSTRNYLTGAKIADPGNIRCAGVDFTLVDSGSTPVVGRRTGRLAAMFGFCRAFRKAVRLRANGPDVIVGSAPSLIAAWGACAEARQRGIPFVLEIRDLWPLTLIDVGRHSRWHPGVLLFGALERALYRRADHIVTLLPHAASHIAKVCARPARITWIPNGVDLDLARHARSDTHGPGIAAQDGAFVMMYAGAHGPANALDAIIDAAALLERRQRGRFQFVFIGDGHDKTRLQRRVEAERLESVVFLDPVPKAEVYELLSSADGLVVNMNRGNLYQSGISFNKLYDYLAVGRPIVFGTDAINNPVAEAGAGVTVPPNDAGALAAAVERVASLSPAEREAIGTRARAFVEEHYDIERLAERFACVLRSVSVGQPAVKVSA